MSQLVRGMIMCGATAMSLAGPAHAQRSYGPTRVWWEPGQGGFLPWTEDYENTDGQVRILNKNGSVQTKDHPFFEALGANGRACVTCHQPSNAMSISTKSIGERWTETGGADPLFAAVDGSNCPDLDQKARSSHSLLVDRGLFRIALPWPKDGAAEFRLEVVRDPTGCNTSPRYGLASARHEISVFRRPRVAANLTNLERGPEGAVLMADGREPTLQAQAITAALIHEQADHAPSAEQLRSILDFETQVYAAQNSDVRGGMLDENDGPAILGSENLASGAGVTAASVMSFASWTQSPSDRELGVQLKFRASVARGSSVFASHCVSCHAAGTTRWMDNGTANLAAADASSDLPLFKATCESGRVMYTHDPGRALVSGKCQDIGAIVMPQFRGLAARAPYFSNGSAATLRDVVDYYDGRDNSRLSEHEKEDLINFLRVL